jgi:ADP-ribose pyrophosphatase YjhB (NUDIX family)
MHTLFEVSCKVILFNHDRTKIVLVKYDSGVHSLPGGHLELNETLEQAARRELREELGINYQGELKHSDFILRPTLRPSDTDQKIVLTFIGELDESLLLPKVTNQQEHSVGGQWFEIKQIITGETNNYLLKEYQALV